MHVCADAFAFEKARELRTDEHLKISTPCRGYNLTDVSNNYKCPIPFFSMSIPRKHGLSPPHRFSRFVLHGERLRLPKAHLFQRRLREA